jgi:hypothetical protein
MILFLELDAKGIHLRLVRVALPGHTWAQKEKTAIVLELMSLYLNMRTAAAR